MNGGSSLKIKRKFFQLLLTIHTTLINCWYRLEGRHTYIYKCKNQINLKGNFRNDFREGCTHSENRNGENEEKQTKLSIWFFYERNRDINHL